MFKDTPIVFDFQHFVGLLHGIVVQTAGTFPHKTVPCLLDSILRTMSCQECPNFLVIVICRENFKREGRCLQEDGITLPLPFQTSYLIKREMSVSAVCYSQFFFIGRIGIFLWQKTLPQPNQSKNSGHNATQAKRNPCENLLHFIRQRNDSCRYSCAGKKEKHQAQPNDPQDSAIGFVPDSGI